MAQIDSDPLRELEDRLWRWRVFYLDSIRLPTGGWSCALGRMVDEAHEVSRRTKRVRGAVVAIRKVRNALRQAKVLHLEAAAKAASQRPPEEAPSDLEIAHIHRAAALAVALAAEPMQTSGLPWASMIHGEGTRPDPHCPEEEETDAAIAKLPEKLRDLLMLHIVSDLPADEKCKVWELSERTYWRRVNDAKLALKEILGV